MNRTRFLQALLDNTATEEDKWEIPSRVEGYRKRLHVYTYYLALYSSLEKRKL